MREPTNKARLMMEGKDGETRDVGRLNSVRRRLFHDDSSQGQPTTVDSDDNLFNRFFEDAKRDREEKKKKWNFDFEKGVPLPGRFEWTRIDADGNEIPIPVASTSEINNKTENGDNAEDKRMETDEEPGESAS